MMPAIPALSSRVRVPKRTEGIITQELALKYIAEHLSTNYGSTFKTESPVAQLRYVTEIISRELFPHIAQLGTVSWVKLSAKKPFLGLHYP